MSDNKKYYYIKLKDNYFDQDNIKILESVKNGHVYSLIIVKLYLKATKYGGQLRMTESIPYDPSKLDILANVLNHDIAHVKEAIKLASELGIISILDTGAMWMDEIQNFIGHSSSEADRIREYRKGLKKESVQLYDKSTPKKEIEKDIEIELNYNEHFESIWKLYPLKKGKGRISKSKLKTFVKYSIEEWTTIIERYNSTVSDKNYLMHGSTFFNGGYVDYLDENYEEVKPLTFKTEEEKRYYSAKDMIDNKQDPTPDDLKWLEEKRVEMEVSLNAL